MKQVVLLAGLLLLFSCNMTQVKDEPQEQPALQVPVAYAEGFTIADHGSFKLIRLSDAWKGEKTNYQYVLYKDQAPTGYDDAIKIRVPVTSIACMSLTHIALIEALGKENTIVAASGCNYSNSGKIKALVQSGKITEVGSENALNYELLAQSKPDVVMMFGINEASLKYVNKLKTMGMTTIMNAEYMEPHPLGKAEWIKFVAAFFDESEKADSIFSVVEKEYLSLVELTQNINNKPLVFVGMPWNGNWYVAGGKSFQAQLFQDAGARYLWDDNEERSSVVKSMELVYDKAYDAEFWLNQNSYGSIEAVVGYDEKFKHFRSVKTGRLYNNNKRMNEFEGNDYWESGTINPHLILKDMIEIFHPELLDHELYYYQQLQ
ncbi:MAG: ABC transporter substrate-binding protein [Flavobacteriales bacterium]|nr:ABC transporter substrate-binding protein [Flavobacteriales bacterium]